MSYLEKNLQAEKLLAELLEPHLNTVLDQFRASDDGNPFHVHIPDIDTIDIPIADIASLVARTSNAFSKAARFAGMARAQAKLAKGRYERVYKQNQALGSNEKERQANAMKAAQAEHSAMVTAEAIAEIADAYESAARIASESIRKIFDKAGSVVMGQIRESHGHFQEKDFSPY